MVPRVRVPDTSARDTAAASMRPGAGMASPATASVSRATIDAARRAVVGVQVGGLSGPSRGLGFVVDPGGLVVTSARLLQGQGSSAVEVTLATGQRLPVVLIARDALSDVAVLKVEARGLPSIALGESRSLRVGETVVAVGSAEEGEASVATGVVRATTLATGGDLALDLSPRPERTGGPVLNARGEVVGMSAGQAGASSSAAVPVDRMKQMLREVGQKEAARRPGVVSPGSGR
jgi:S1-C subfamily serine protease